jgi:hypothetical protein
MNRSRSLPEPLLSREALARDLAVRRTQIDLMRADGMPVACFTPAGHARFLRSQVDEYMAERARLAARKVAS